MRILDANQHLAGRIIHFEGLPVDCVLLIVVYGNLRTSNTVFVISAINLQN